MGWQRWEAVVLVSPRQRLFAGRFVWLQESVFQKHGCLVPRWKLNPSDRCRLIRRLLKATKGRRS